jgi:Putative helicase
MLFLFQRKRPPVAAAPSPAPALDLPKGLLRPESAASLLATPRRQKLLEYIWQRTSLSNDMPSWSSNFPLPKATITLTRAACSTTAWKSSPTA